MSHMLNSRLWREYYIDLPRRDVKILGATARKKKTKGKMKDDAVDNCLPYDI